MAAVVGVGTIGLFWSNLGGVAAVGIYVSMCGGAAIDRGEKWVVEGAWVVGAGDMGGVLGRPRCRPRNWRSSRIASVVVVGGFPLLLLGSFVASSVSLLFAPSCWLL